MGRGAAGPQVGKIAHEYDSVEKIAPVLQGLGELASAILRHGWAAPANHTTVVAALHARFHVNAPLVRAPSGHPDGDCRPSRICSGVGLT